jgi:hypothetical protein
VGEVELEVGLGLVVFSLDEFDMFAGHPSRDAH